MNSPRSQGSALSKIMGVPNSQTVNPQGRLFTGYIFLTSDHTERASSASQSHCYKQRTLKFDISSLFVTNLDAFVNRFWPITVSVSCPTALGAPFSQLTFRLALYRENAAVTATELLQLLDLACGTLFRSSCAIQTLFRRQLKGHLYREAWTRRSVTSDMRRFKNTYLLTLFTYLTNL